MLYNTIINFKSYVIDTDDFVIEHMSSDDYKMLKSLGYPVVSISHYLKETNSRFIWSLDKCVIQSIDLSNVLVWYEGYYYHIDMNTKCKDYLTWLSINEVIIDVPYKESKFKGAYIDDNCLNVVILGDVIFKLHDNGYCEIFYNNLCEVIVSDFMGIAMPEGVFKSKALLGDR